MVQDRLSLCSKILRKDKKSNRKVYLFFGPRNRPRGKTYVSNIKFLAIENYSEYSFCFLKIIKIGVEKTPRIEIYSPRERTLGYIFNRYQRLLFKKLGDLTFVGIIL